MTKRSFRAPRRPIALSALAVALLAGGAHGQNILTGATPRLIAAATNNNNGAAPFWATMTPGFQSSSGTLVMRGGGRLTEDGGGAHDYSINFPQIGWALAMTSTEVANADIVVPLLSDFRVRFGANNAADTNLNSFALRATVSVFQEATAGAGDWAAAPVQTMNFNRDYGLNGAISDNTYKFTDIARFANLPISTRRYEVRTTYSISGTNRLLGFAGDANTFGELDMNTLGANQATYADTRGAAWNVSVEPTGYNGNSRGVVNAGLARTNFGVDGSGMGGNRIRVGVIEPNASYLNHQSLAGRISILGGGTNQANWTGEHALAVSSIIGSNGPNESSSGIAPGCQIISAPFANYGAGPLAAATQMVNVGFGGAGNAGIINFSQAGPATLTVQRLDQFMNNNTNVTWVSAAGNFQQLTAAQIAADPVLSTWAFSGHVPNPNFAYNILAVGAMDGTFNQPAIFSSTTGGAYPSKPDIMAPGEYILAAASRDLTNTGAAPNQYTRSFLGDDWKYDDNLNTSPNLVNTIGATSGPINGTSFAAPHVSGAVALMQDYGAKHAADYDAWSNDQRVMKAVLLTSASTQGIFSRQPVGGGPPAPWHQDTGPGTGAQGDAPVTVTRSLDQNLGSGLLDVNGAVGLYAAGEIRRAAQNTTQNFRIFGPGANNPDIIGSRTKFWDYERVAADTGAGGRAANGTVDYILGANDNLHFIAETGNWVGTVNPSFSFLRSCLTWNTTTNGAGTAYNALSNLELRVYLDGLNSGNVPGFDPTNPNADILVATTMNNAENTKILDLRGIFNTWTYSINFGSTPPLSWNPKFYLEVVNLSQGGAVDYGVAVTVPAPGATVLLMGAGLLAARRRRA
jgi:Subtilase family